MKPITATCLLITLSLSPLAGARQLDPEWPCVQVLVPEIVAAVVWPQPIDKSTSGSWQLDDSLVAMVEKLNDLDEFAETERQLIADFVTSVPLETRTATLNRLADGIVSLANRRRTQYIVGIKRYTRQQISIAAQVESTLNQLASMDEKAGAGDLTARLEIEETLHWHQRVFDRREHAIQFLCERPVELEERLATVLRELAQYLP